MWGTLSFKHSSLSQGQRRWQRMGNEQVNCPGVLEHALLLFWLWRKPGKEGESSSACSAHQRNLHFEEGGNLQARRRINWRGVEEICLLVFGTNAVFNYPSPSTHFNGLNEIRSWVSKNNPHPTLTWMANQRFRDIYWDSMSSSWIWIRKDVASSQW